MTLKNSKKTLQDTLEQLANQEGNKEAKIDTGMKGVLLKQMAEIAKEEMRDQRRLKAKHLGPQWQEPDMEDETGDLIICDDYKRNDHPPPSNGNGGAGKLAVVGLTIASSLLGAGAATGLVYWLLSNPPRPQPQPVLKPQEFQVDFWVDENGKVQKKVTPVK
jgi:hypothetical protein